MKYITKSISSIFKVLEYGPHLRPVRDWLVLVSIFGTLLSVSVAYNIWLFSKETQGQKIGNAEVTTPFEIRLEQVKSLFAERETERNRYTNEYRFVDPSL